MNKGSGWVWLVYDVRTKSLLIMHTKDNIILPRQYVPLLVVDVWEHAYYLQY